MKALPRTLLLSAALAVTLGACGNKEPSKAKDSDSSEPASDKAKGSSAPSSAALPPASLPTDADAAVVAEIKKVAPCPRKDGSREDGCEAFTAWETYRDKYHEEDDLNQTKQKKLTKACFSMVGDPSENIREVAYDCLAYNVGAVESPKAVISFILSKLEGETIDAVRTSMLMALDNLDPPKNGGADQVLALAKKLAPREDVSFVVSKLMDALAPDDKDTEPTADAFTFAVEQLGKGKNVHDACDILVTTKAKKEEACKALLGLVETKKYPWGTGIYSMGRLGDACKPHYDKVVEVVVAKAGEAEGYDKGFGPADAIYLEQLVGKGGFTADQKTKLVTAVEPLVKSAKNESTQKSYQSLVDALKK